MVETLREVFDRHIVEREALMDPHVRKVLDDGSRNAVLCGWALEMLGKVSVVANPEKCMAEAVGQRIRAARVLRGMSMSQLADSIGLQKGQQYINRVELGSVPNLGVPQVARLARILQVDPGWLAFGTGLEPEGIDLEAGLRKNTRTRRHVASAG